MEIITNAIEKMKKGIFDKEVLIAVILSYMHENEKLESQIQELKNTIKTLEEKIKN